MAAYACNPNTQKVKSGKSQVQDQSVLHRKAQSQKQKTKAKQNNNNNKKKHT
jgi:hypothetical protein